MSDDKFSGALQENVLTLLCFDTDAAGIIRNMVQPELFSNRIYQTIAIRAIEFLDTYKEAVAEHLPDILEVELDEKADRKRATLYKRTLEHLYAARDHANSKYILESVSRFVHEQTLKAGMLRAMDAIEAGNIVDAELALTDAIKQEAVTFDAGLNLTDTKHALRFLDRVDDGIPIGIKELDKRGVTPAPGTVWCIIAPAKKGKSWALTHVGKAAIRQRKRVVHITLEMPDWQCAQRYIQSFFAISKREAKVQVPVMQVKDGQFLGIGLEEQTRPTLTDTTIRKHIEAKVRATFKADCPILIKSFPSGALTMPMLRAYLDTLERQHNFIPDMVILDYPGIMKISSAANKRNELGQHVVEFRGLMQERNCAGVIAAQGNRESADARTVTDTHIGEDYSIVQTCDAILTYSQTREERRLGLARLYVSNARGDEDKFTVLITQCYAMGQFAIDSHAMTSDYWDRVAPRAAA